MFELRWISTRTTSIKFAFNFAYSHVCEKKDTTFDRRICHALKESIADHESYQCDACNSSIPKESMVYSCRQCNYDECHVCFESVTFETQTLFSKWYTLNRMIPLCMGTLVSSNCSLLYHSIKNRNKHVQNKENHYQIAAGANLRFFLFKQENSSFTSPPPSFRQNIVEGG